MNITPKQRRIFWIAAAILAAIYYAPTIVTLVSPLHATAQKGRLSAIVQPVMAAMAQQGDPARGSVGRGGETQPPRALTLPDISGVWGNTTTMRPGTTATYRIELTQTRNTITGRSRREIDNPDGSTYVVYPITGTSVESGTAFTFQEGKLIESYPPMQSWCPIRTMTLVPTADGMLVGSVDAPPCGPGTILLKRTK